MTLNIATDVFRQLVDRGGTLRRRLKGIDESEMGARYPQVREGERAQAIDSWRTEMIEFLQHLGQDLLPELRRERSSAAAAAREALEDGRLGGGRAEAPNPMAGIESWDAAAALTAQGRATVALLTELTAIRTELEVGNLRSAYAAVATEEIATELSAWVDRAQGKNGATFPFAKWFNVQRALIPVLRSRANDKDDRAAMLLGPEGQLSRIEEALIAASVPGSEQLLTGIERSLAQLGDVVQRLSVADGPAQVFDLLDSLERQIDRSEGRDPMERLRKAEQEESERENAAGEKRRQEIFG